MKLFARNLAAALVTLSLALGVGAVAQASTTHPATRDDHWCC